MTGLLPPQNAFAPDASWTKQIPSAKLLNCVAVAQQAFQQAEQKFREIDRKGIDRERVRVAAFLPRLPHMELDRGCRRYASFMSKKFRDHGLDFRVEEALSADALELLIMGAQTNDKIHGTFIFFPTPFDRTEDYFLRRVKPEKDIEGLTIENTGRMALNLKSFDEEHKYEGVVPCTARAILALLHHYEPIKALFPKDLHERGPAVAILNSSARIGIPLQSMLMRIGATTAMCHVQTRCEDRDHFLAAADIVVTAYPARSEADLVRHVKKGAVVIDCSTDGNLHPDIVDQAGYISPCDNHLGQVTTALALYNTALCALWQHGRNE
jgi:methylenetetrahydrofolate dehydrogenase (NADP+) / methenyltetrahydrofolate cyclohydrolase